ncbi:MAG: hypothetical protein WA970_15895 [Gammaproteobacteria bacterium]
MPLFGRFATVQILYFPEKVRQERRHPRATKHEEITQVLAKAGEEDIEIVLLTDEMIIHIRTAPKQAPLEQKKGKWAHVAEEFSTRAPLLGMSEQFLDLTQRFRQNFALKSPFDPQE